MVVINPHPGIIVKTSIMPGIDESLHFDRIEFWHPKQVIKTGPSNLEKIAIVPEIDASPYE